MVFGMLLILIPSYVFATEFIFGDSAIYWTNWESSNSDGYVNDNITDAIGHPNLTGGNGISEGGYLTSLNIFYTNYDSLVKAGDLFIDVGNNGNFNYVLTNDGRIYQFNDEFLSSSKGVNDSSYIVTTKWPGYYIRNDHPYELDESLLPSGSYIGTYNFSEFNGDGSVNYSGLNLLVGSDFTIAFAVSCANDVLYERVSTPVPEPATMLLLGTGLIGLAGVGRKQLLKK